MWNSEIYSVDLLRDVMEVFKFYNSSYNVHEQQDALEFFMWIVDRIHVESCSGNSGKKKSLKNKAESKVYLTTKSLEKVSYA